MRNRIILGVIIVLGIIVWRGLGATTEKNFTCEYKLVYAVCKPKTGSPKLPTIMEILKAGVKF